MVDFAIDNLRLRELAAIAEQNKAFFDDFVSYLRAEGYDSLYDFVADEDSDRATQVIHKYLVMNGPGTSNLYDGVSAPYPAPKAKWLLVAWIFRDAPGQRLRPMVASMPGNTVQERQARLLNSVREYVRSILPLPEDWEWAVIKEVVIDRLEGSRRAKKGTLFEIIVRRALRTMFDDNGIPLDVPDSEVRLGGETYDVQVNGDKGTILMPVKTRETMGGGHAYIFTRDIYKSVSVASQSGYNCVPVVIAESWTGDLAALECDDFIYIPVNPNQVTRIEPLLKAELSTRLDTFREIA